MAKTKSKMLAKQAKDVKKIANKPDPKVKLGRAALKKKK